MSVFHRVDDLEHLPASRAVPMMTRLPIYDGAVRFAFQQESTNPQQVEVSQPEPTEPAPALSADQLMAMNSNALYGPMQGQTVGMFDVVKVPAA